MRLQPKGALGVNESEGVVRSLRARGYRLTPQRVAVLRVMQGRRCHLSVNQVVECLQDQYPTLTAPTVYRILQWLKDTGLVAETDLGGGHNVFEYIAGKPHHHLVCTRCGKVIELPDSFVAPLREAIEAQYHFVPCVDHMGLWGICSECQRADKPAGEQETR